MSLFVGGQALAVPVTCMGGAPEQVFAALCTKFKLPEVVGKYLVSAKKMDSLEDFACFFLTEEEVGAVFDEIPDIKDKQIVASRLRQAWRSARTAGAIAEDNSKRGPDAVDEELPPRELSTLRDLFHARYKMRFPVALEPSDLVISRLSKEIARRQLPVHNVFKVRTATQHMRAPRKRARLFDGIEIVTGEPEHEAEPRNDLHTYLSLHHTLMIAFARAGAVALLPAPAEPETAGSDSTSYVQVPLDVVLGYHERLRRCAAEMPAHRALSFVQQRDEEERQWWSDRFRNSALPLGKVIAEGIEKREVMWLPSSAPPPPQRPDPPARRLAEAPARKAEHKASRAGQGGQPWPTADCLKNGVKLCRAFNSAKGCSEPCPRNLKHACGAILGRNGHVCGLTNHGAAQCLRAGKAGAAKMDGRAQSSGGVA